MSVHHVALPFAILIVLVASAAYVFRPDCRLRVYGVSFGSKGLGEP